MPTSLFRIEVAPLTPLPLERSPLFSYRSKESIPPGSLVEISFGKRYLQGIVFESAKLPGRAPLWMKPVGKVILPSWLTSKQRLLAKYMGETYFSSLGNSLKHFVFPLSKKILADCSLNTKISSRHQTKKVTLSPEKDLIQEVNSDQALWTMVDHALASARPKETCLILLPNLILAEFAAQRYSAMFPHEIAVITSKLTKKALFESWQQIRSGSIRFIFGTRQALFAPFPKLTHIIMLFPEETLSYKQWEMTPHYTSLSLIHFLKQSFHSKLTLLTTSLGLREQELAPSKALSPPYQPLIIDRRKDGKGARSRAFAKSLQTLLEETTKQQKILLVAKERGASGIMICQHCRNTARCPDCEHVLSEAGEGNFRCLSCGFKSDFFPKCRTCSGMNFIPFGFGTIRVEKETERLLLGRRVLRIDRDALETTAGWKKTLDKLCRGQFDVLITTHEIGTLLPLPPLDLIAMLEGDHVLRRPEFDSEERLALQVKRLLAKLAPKGQCVIQTFSPEERIWQNITAGTFVNYFELLLEERKLLGYPPATAIIQLTPLELSFLKKKIDTAEMEKKRDELVKLLVSSKDFRVPSLLIRPTTQKSRPSPASILIKYPPQQELPPKLLTWLKQHSSQFSIDFEPYQL